MGSVQQFPPVPLRSGDPTLNLDDLRVLLLEAERKYVEEARGALSGLIEEHG